MRFSLIPHLSRSTNHGRVLDHSSRHAVVAATKTLAYTASTEDCPYWHRPQADGLFMSALGLYVPYHVHKFRVKTEGYYDFQSEGANGWPTCIYLYANKFDPAYPLDDFIAGNSSPRCSHLLNIHLVPSVTYYWVTTGFGNSDGGTFFNESTAPVF